MNKEEKKGMTHTEIVKKLIGKINPEGRSEIDGERMENLKAMCELVNDLIIEIDNVSYRNRDRYEHSMKVMGKYADNFLTNTLGIKE